ncbi:wnt family protein [Onchocerca flexuosa]|uniref:Protein Wnt n=1 Tax=Onchocerca flexuosa TaxID=387005 RepID=A0A238BZ73_9BILA|nr:wnt family protein [Onchocerca flexuosa]
MYTMILINHCLAVITIFLNIAAAQHYNWLSLALSSTAQYSPAFHAASDYDKQQYRILCERLLGLNPAQISICQQHPFAIPSIGRGARDSVVECQAQFKFERWNCSEKISKQSNITTNGFQDLLGQTLRAGNRETAFISAVASAGIVHAITKGCSAGNLTECGCDSQPKRNHKNCTIEDHASAIGREKFSWGGCSDNSKYGVHFAKQFLDRFEREQYEKDRDIRHLMNLHNNFVGREAIVQNMRKHCRCHGVSGSCEFKTCWLQMPRFAEIGEMLKQRYNHFAVQVAKRAKKRLRRKERSERKKPLRGNEIAYINKSPNYCERNDAEGILGTHGRECNQSSLNSDSCDLLCCGRGYNTKEEIRTVQCHCKIQTDKI